MASTFDSTKKELKKLLEEIAEGKIQLPDFQRGWVWDDAHIQSLLVSIARSFPIGSVMLLETGGLTRFQIRPVEGVLLPSGIPNPVERLILDGQQRLTSLTQVLTLKTPVNTKDGKGREVLRHYYLNIEKSLLSPSDLEDAIIAVDERRTVRTNFGRDVLLDLDSTEKEFSTFCFPCDQILNSDRWEQGLFAFDPSKIARYMEFRSRVLTPFREYQVPLIELKKETSKEAVCLVFEKVNTGGVPLSVFELATATYAADGFNLRNDWYGDTVEHIVGRHQKFASQPLLRNIVPTEFLQGVSLLHTYELRCTDLTAGKSPKEATAVSAKREHVLALPLEAYKKWADQLTEGFFQADRFLRMEGFHHPQFLPYRSQLIPLATLMVHLGERWLEHPVHQKLARWFWSGVLGEIYGGAVETRIALDLQQVLAWINEAEASEPVTVNGAGFQPSRLDTLRTRTSAAYRGIYVLLQRQSSRDFFWQARMVELDRDECKIDIHHIFPKAWCLAQGLAPKVFNSIVNKTAISYKANRMIGGKAPSLYLTQIETQAKISSEEMDKILISHLIATELLRADQFHAFYEKRRAALLEIIGQAMGKPVLPAGGEPPVEDEEDDEAPEESDSI
jgi:hypothetical protein